MSNFQTRPQLCTTFSVTTVVGGEILVAAEEGAVEVTQPGGTLVAEPGEAAEVSLESGIFRNVSFRRDQLEEFGAQWLRERVDAFVADAPRVLRFYGQLCVQARETCVR